MSPAHAAALHCSPVRILKDNYVWVLHKPCHAHAWIVDPGDAEPVLQFLAARHLVAQGILITHHHGDHTHGVPALQQQLGPIPVIGPEASPCDAITDRVQEGDTVSLLNTVFHVMSTPGHTLDHVVYWNAHHMLCGDTLFSAGCGRLFEGTPEMMWQSLQRIMRLPDTLLLYPAHEYTRDNLRFAAMVEPDNPAVAHAMRNLPSDGPTLPTSLGHERRVNPFLRCQDSAHFALLRQWKDHV